MTPGRPARTMAHMEDEHGRTRRRTVTAYVLLLLALTQVAVGAGALAVAGVSGADLVHYDMVIDLAVGLAYPVCGTVIALHRPRNPIGWLLIVYGLGHAFTGLSTGLAVEGLRAGWSPEALHVLTTIGRHTWIVASSTAFVFVFFLFPDGRLPGRRWRWALIAQLVASPWTSPTGRVTTGGSTTAPEPSRRTSRCHQAGCPSSSEW